MGNRVINIGSSGSQTENINRFVYKDLDMVSEKRVKGQDLYRTDSLLDVHAVQNSLDNIFHWIPGERILDPEFASKLYYYLYEGITDQNQEKIIAEIKHSVSKYEPRAVIDQVQKVTSTDEEEDNTVVLNIVYHIKGLADKEFQSQYSFVKTSK